MTTIRPVILAGRAGSQRHPLSSSDEPLEFQHVLEGDSSFQEALERVSDPEFLPPLIICEEALHGLVIEQCDEIAFEYEEILLETEGRNTALATVTAALWARGRGESYPLLICPCDHFIADQGAFMRAVLDAAYTADQGYLVTFGAVADRAETAYGYIEVGMRLDTRYSGHNILQFVEKPTYEQAEAFLEAGRFVWNTGLLCATPDLLISEMQHYQPELLAASKQALAQGPILSYPNAPALSLEKALLEKSDKKAVVSLLTAWSDLGNWPGIWKALSLI